MLLLMALKTKIHLKNNVSFDDTYNKDIPEQDILNIINNLEDDTAACCDKVNVKFKKSI